MKFNLKKINFYKINIYIKFFTKICKMKRINSIKSMEDTVFTWI